MKRLSISTQSFIKMMNKTLSPQLASLALGILLLTLSSCGGGYDYLTATKTSNEIGQIQNRLQKVYYMYLGHFTNEAQAKVERNPIYKGQEIISVPIWPQRGNEHWMYVNWMQADKPDDLLVQEVWFFKRKDPETIEVKIYDLPDKEKYADDWRKKEPLKNLKPDDLIDHGNCSTEITAISSDKFKIKSAPCRRDLSDVIKYVEMDGEATSKKITFYNTMFNSKEKKIFSYDKGIKFVRMSKEDPKYAK